jgi:hypothetical protein
MSDERVVERYFESAADLVVELTRQIARLAYAAEQQVVVMITADTELTEPCVACGCRLMTRQYDECPACRAPTRNHA